MQIESTIPIERNEVEIIVKVIGHYYPGCKGVHTLSNGDPGYPEEFAEICDVFAYDNKGQIELSRREMERANSALWDAVNDSD